MRYLLIFPAALLALASCKQKTETAAETASTKSPLNGSWRLISSKSITKDTVDTSPKSGVETVKLYNDTHFTFFTHDTKKGKIDTPLFSAGAGTYTLSGDKYTEHLQYCNAREWEDHDFEFTMALKNDTMTQRGVEKVPGVVDHVIIETYVKMK